MTYLTALIPCLLILAASSITAWATMPSPHVDIDELVRRWKGNHP